MKKFNILLYGISLLFGISLLALSLYGLETNSYYVRILINTSMFFIYARIALIATLVTYAFVPRLRIYTTRTLVFISGLLMMSLGLMSVSLPSLLGHTNTYMLIGDSVTLLEGGILAIILSSELSAQRSHFTVNVLSNIQIAVYRFSKKFALPSYSKHQSSGHNTS